MPEVAEMKGKITPEGVQAFRNRIGVLIPTERPWVTEAHPDTIRHFAFSYGDNNPLYNDPAYGVKTRWKSLIAPPLYANVTGQMERRKIPDNVRQAGAGALTGVPNYMSGSEWEWVRPIQPGDQIQHRYFIADVVEKRSEFGGGKAVIIYHRHEYINQRSELVTLYTNYFFHVEREASQKKGKYMAIEPKVWTQEEQDEIDKAYAAESRRGKETLYWEDVSVDTAMPVRVRGPLAVVDIISWHVGRGMGVFGVAPLYLGYLNRRRVPAFYVKNEYGAWDVAQRVHWEDAYAKRVGNPRAYDYGAMRTSWMVHYLTDWVGDEGWVWKESDQSRKFNYHGDIQWVKAKVKGKRQEADRNIVDLEVWCENQRGDVATSGSASVLLPSRAGGPVRIPAGDAKATSMKTDFAAAWPGCVW